jgi:hypothetical protein
MAITRFDREDIVTLLQELGARLDARGLGAEVFVLGGSAIAVAYDARRVTADIDEIFVPVDQVEREVAAMAEEHGLPLGWLNNAVVGTLQGVLNDDAPRDLLASAGIAVKVASPEYILALKAMISTRELDRDIEDAATLCHLLGITSERELEGVARRYFGARSALGVQELRFERIIDRAERMRARDGVALPVRAGTMAAPGLRGSGLCGQWMKISKRYCALPVGHRGQHR